MKTRIQILFLIVVGLAILAFKGFENDTDWTACLKKCDSGWGLQCKDCKYYKETYKRSFDDTYTVKMHNVCDERIDAKICVQEEDKSWRCKSVPGLPPKDTITMCACKGTGKYLYWVRRTGDKEIILPSDDEINQTYKD